MCIVYHITYWYNHIMINHYYLVHTTHWSIKHTLCKMSAMKYRLLAKTLQPTSQPCVHHTIFYNNWICSWFKLTGECKVPWSQERPPRHMYLPCEAEFIILLTTLIQCTMLMYAPYTENYVYCQYLHFCGHNIWLVWFVVEYYDACGCVVIGRYFCTYNW